MTENMDRFNLPRFLFLARFILGLVFLYASFGKIMDPKAFSENLMAYHIFDSPLAIKYVAVTLPWVEWFCGIFLILGVFVRSMAVLSSLLLLIFLLSMASALVRGLEINCGCFGSAHETIGLYSLFRDGLFFIMSLTVLFSKVDSYTLQAFFFKRKNSY